jgi:hypothetical protein
MEHKMNGREFDEIKEQVNELREGQKRITEILVALEKKDASARSRQRELSNM